MFRSNPRLIILNNLWKLRRIRYSLSSSTKICTFLSVVSEKQWNRGNEMSNLRRGTKTGRRMQQMERRAITLKFAVAPFISLYALTEIQINDKSALAFELLRILSLCHDILFSSPGTLEINRKDYFVFNFFYFSYSNSRFLRIPMNESLSLHSRLSIKVGWKNLFYFVKCGWQDLHTLSLLDPSS